MSLTVTRYEAARDRVEWDGLCQRAPMATLLHTRSFLSYHMDRFHDESRVVRNAQGKLIGMLPAACIQGQRETVISHPGATFGGLIHGGDVLGDELLKVLTLICTDLKASGFCNLRYKAVPHIYHRWPAGDDLYALWRLGAQAYRCDLSSTVDATARQPVGSQRKRALRKSQTAGTRVFRDADHLAAFWPILTETLQSRHEAMPAHTLDEMRMLMALFPQDIELVAAEINGQLEAGVLLFHSSCVAHAQYIASSAAGRQFNALDAIFEHCIVAAQERKCRYFDFGISNEDDGRYLNTGLYQFKSGFGGGGVIHEQFQLDFNQQFSERCDAILRN